MTDDHDTTPIPTDVLRAWMESDNRLLSGDEDVALYRAAVAALPPPRRPVTRETPLGTRLIDPEYDGDDYPRTFVAPHPYDDDRFILHIGGDLVGYDPGIRVERYYGWYEVDEPEPAPLPGTRVGDRMTEHTPVGAEVELEEWGRRKVTAHRRDGFGAWFDNGMWASYDTAGTVVALPEESER